MTGPARPELDKRFRPCYDPVKRQEKIMNTIKSVWDLQAQLLVLGARRVYRERKIKQLLARIKAKKEEKKS